jgi:hypothetical protein
VAELHHWASSPSDHQRLRNIACRLSTAIGSLPHKATRFHEADIAQSFAQAASPHRPHSQRRTTRRPAATRSIPARSVFILNPMAMRLDVRVNVFSLADNVIEQAWWPKLWII